VIRFRGRARQSSSHDGKKNRVAENTLLHLFLGAAADLSGRFYCDVFRSYLNTLPTLAKKLHHLLIF
jgi:hypothetical protein